MTYWPTAKPAVEVAVTLALPLVVVMLNDVVTVGTDNLEDPEIVAALEIVMEVPEAIVLMVAPAGMPTPTIC